VAQDNLKVSQGEFDRGSTGKSDNLWLSPPTVEVYQAQHSRRDVPSLDLINNILGAQELQLDLARAIRQAADSAVYLQAALTNDWPGSPPPVMDRLPNLLQDGFRKEMDDYGSISSTEEKVLSLLWVLQGSLYGCDAGRAGCSTRTFLLAPLFLNVTRGLTSLLKRK